MDVRRLRYSIATKRYRGRWPLEANLCGRKVTGKNVCFKTFEVFVSYSCFQKRGKYLYNRFHVACHKENNFHGDLVTENLIKETSEVLTSFLGLSVVIAIMTAGQEILDLISCRI